MNDLISRSALIERHCEGCSADVRESCKTDPVCAALMWVVEEPTVEAVPVVRCGECIKPIEDCPFKDSVMLKTDYCSYGERRNGDG